MTTETEKAISERETRSRNKAKKRAIGKYGDDYVDPEELAEPDEDEAKPAKAAKK